MAKFKSTILNTSSKGASLIEVMVALVILVIGLIGIFNLHIVAKRGSFESFQQTQASYYASDIINRMRLNRSELASYAGTYSGLIAKPSKSCDVKVGAVVLCSPTETRLWDLYQWEQSLMGAAEVVGTQNVGGLDTPTACITLKGETVAVVVAWRGIQAGSGTNYVNSDCGKTLGDRRRALSLTTVII